MSASRLHHNVLYNLAGSVIPILAALITIPIYIRTIGEVRYGLLSLIWLAFGYFGIFDLGLSRAAAYRLSALRKQDLSVRVSVFYTACSLSLCMGVFACFVFHLVAVPLAEYFTVDPLLRAEILRALPLISLFFPISLLGGIFGGCLQAEERFLVLNLQQSVGSILVQCLPLALTFFIRPSLELAVLGAVVARFISVGWLGVSCFTWARAAGRTRASFSHVKDLFAYGGWITFSDMIAPLLNGLDQMIIGATLGPRAIAHYSVPFSMASKILIIPASFNRAVFPRMSAMHTKDARELSKKALSIVAHVMALLSVPGIILVQPALEIWIGKEFANEAHLAASILIVGMWFNSIGYIPWTFLQSQGRPDVVAKIHALELLPFVAMLYGLIWLFGLPGAALAWCLRIILDVALQSWFAKFRWSDGRSVVFPGMIVILAMLVTSFHPALAWSLIAASVLCCAVTIKMMQEEDLVLYTRPEFWRRT
jgi:O-antigen/teichoic acid export membrane protein